MRLRPIPKRSGLRKQSGDLESFAAGKSKASLQKTFFGRLAKLASDEGHLASTSTAWLLDDAPAIFRRQVTKKKSCGTTQTDDPHILANYCGKKLCLPLV